MVNPVWMKRELNIGAAEKMGLTVRYESIMIPYGNRAKHID